MIAVREADIADAPSIAKIRAESWRVAYSGIIAADVLARFTSEEAIQQRVDAMRGSWPGGMLLAEADRPGGVQAAALGVQAAALGGRPPAPAGFAHFGPEREVESRPGQESAPEDTAVRAELYAIYVLPEYWSAGVGDALMTEVLQRVRADGYPEITLWVLEDNERARRFYERSGFHASGQSMVLDWLGGITEVEYARGLA